MQESRDFLERNPLLQNYLNSSCPLKLYHQSSLPLAVMLTLSLHPRNRHAPWLNAFGSLGI